jgi:phage terminase large subunit
VLVNWRDNPWFPDVLKKEMAHDFATDPERAEHIWEGAYGVDEGAIIARLVDKAEREGRINDEVDYDPDGAPIEISTDIGFRDTASWWFWQRKNNGYTLFDYDEDSGLDAEEWFPRLEEKLEGRKLGKIWLPHDARAKTFQSKYTVVDRFLSKFGSNRVGVIPRSSKTDRINAARYVIRSCEFNKTRCERGLDGLRAWIYAWDPDKQVFSREPEHNWASHPSDGYSYGCQVMQFATVPEDDTKPVKWPHQQTANEVFWPKTKDAPSKEWV